MIADAESKLFIDVSSTPSSRCELFIRLSQPWRLARDLPSGRCQYGTVPGPAESQNTASDNSCGNPCLIWREFGGSRGADVRWPPKNRPGKKEAAMLSQKISNEAGWLFSADRKINRPLLLFSLLLPSRSLSPVWSPFRYWRRNPLIRRSAPRQSWFAAPSQSSHTARRSRYPS